MRKYETAKDYKTLTDRAIRWTIEDNLKALVDYLNNGPLNDEPLSRSEAVKVSVSLNNLLKDLGL